MASYSMRNHEICVFDTHRIIPRFIINRVADHPPRMY